MARSIYLLLIVCAAVFTVIPASAGDDKAPQPATLSIHIWDYCDPATFGALCTRADTSSGVITRSGFGFELNLDKSVGAWRFAPEKARAGEGTSLMLRNLGGETHTFTRVKQFGGGFIAALNTASGNPVPAPECAQMVGGKLVPQPPSANNIFVPAGTTTNGPQLGEGGTARFQCCIHPWMRTTIKIRDDDHDHHDDDAAHHEHENH